MENRLLDFAVKGFREWWNQTRWSCKGEAPGFLRLVEGGIGAVLSGGGGCACLFGL